MATFSIKDFFTTTRAKMLSFVINTDENIPAKVNVDSDGAEVLGKAVASPAANTVLDRLKALETAAASTNTKLDTAITALQTIDNMQLAAGTANIGDVDVLTVPADPFGVNADAASATGSVSAKLRALATALGVTPLDLGIGTGGTRTLRVGIDSSQAPAVGQATMAASTPVVFASDQTAIPVTGQSGGTVSADVVLPTSSVYAVNDCISDSTSAPTSGGFTFTGAARISGGSGVITDAVIVSSVDAATPLQGEIWLFDSAVTNVNDNAAFVVSDAEIKTYVGKIPFALEDAGNNQAAHITGLNVGFTCVGSANLRFLIKAKNAYTPATDTLTVRIKTMHTS